MVLSFRVSFLCDNENQPCEMEQYLRSQPSTVAMIFSGFLQHISLNRGPSNAVKPITERARVCTASNKHKLTFFPQLFDSC